jgi:uncharacterized membrane protein YraQ (UPF0718 family)
MPADLASTLVLILLTAADTVLQLWPYVVAGILVAVLLQRAMQGRAWSGSLRLAPALTMPTSALLGAASPLPTIGMVPVVLRLHEEGFPARSSLAFVVASSLMNPQLLVLTLGALGTRFALTQLAAVLTVSSLLGLLFGTELRKEGIATGRDSGDARRAGQSVPGALFSLAGHVSLYFLLGAIAGAAARVLLQTAPGLGAVNWLGTRGWLSTPILGWLGAPFYTCGGSAVPLASSLGQAGFSQGTLLAFLLVGPALRGSSLANLGCLLPRRRVVACIVVLALASGLLGLGLDGLLVR